MRLSAGLTHILDSVSYAVVAIDLDCRVLYLNKSANLFLKARGRVVAEYIGESSEVLLPLATPKAREAMADAEFQRGNGRIVAKGKDLFYEITP